MLLGKERYSSLDLRVRVKSGGHVSQMYAVRQASRRLLWRTTRSMWTRPPRRRSRIPFSSTTGPCWSPTQGGASQRSSEEGAPGLGSRSPTDRVMNPHFLWRVQKA